MSGCAAKSVFFVSILALASAAPLLALDPSKELTQYALDVWQTADGLPQNSVQTLIQSRDGYLWIGTEEGLARFDGARFTVFDRANTDAMRTSNVQALLEGRDGTLYLGLYGGGLLAQAKYHFVEVSPRELLSNSVTALSQDPDGALWVGTPAGLSRYREGSFETCGPESGVPLEPIGCLYVDRAGVLWIGTGSGLLRVQGGKSRRYTREDGLGSNTVLCMAEDGPGDLWAGTTRGLARMRPEGFQTYTRRDGLSDDYVRTLLCDRHGCLWVGTNGGLNRLKDGAFSSIRASDGLSSDLITAIAEDSEGSLWIGTGSGGLNRLKDSVFTTFGLKQGLPVEQINSIAGSRDGGFWAAGWHGEVARFEGGAFVSMRSGEALHQAEVMALLEDSKGHLWVGTRQALYGLAGGRFVSYAAGGAAGGAPAGVRTICETRSGALWFGTETSGLCRYDGRTWMRYSVQQGLADNRVRALLEDRAGRLWIGTYGGLDRFADGRFSHYGVGEGLPVNLVRCLHEDAEGTLWIGTYGGGLARYRDGKFSAFTSRDGLLSDVIFQILEDALGNLWIGCNKGVYRVSKADLDSFATRAITSIPCTAYGPSDGMASSGCNGGGPAGLRTPDGKLWFATLEGAVVVDPARLKTNSTPPPVVIEAMIVDSEPACLGVDMELPPGRQRLEFHYAGLSFLAPEKVRFKYRLDGLDRSWVDAGNRRSAYYTNLSPGYYTFHVIACNNDGIWNQAGDALSFTLRPHFYQTHWFTAVVLVSALLAGAGLYLLRIRRLKIRERELVQLVEARTKSLRDAIDFKDEVVSIVSHDFRTPLTVIEGYAELLEHGADDDEMHKLSIIRQQVKHLATLASDTLTMSRIESGNMPLQMTSVDINELVRSAVEEHRTNADVTYDGPADRLISVRADALRLRQIIDNLISNAVKYSPVTPVIHVSLRTSDAEVHVSVKDNGSGIPPEEMGNLFQRFRRLGSARSSSIQGSGLGLYISRWIIESHGGRIWADSTPGQGSTFTFSLPLAAGDAPQGY
ncbi:MAG: two-component regulator propeller domain-containing protein [Acidobacteriota bacterium]